MKDPVAHAHMPRSPRWKKIGRGETGWRTFYLERNRTKSSLYNCGLHQYSFNFLCRDVHADRYILTCWRTDELTYLRNVLTYWRTDVLTHWRTDVLMYWRTDVLTYWRTDVLTYWRTDVLTYWRTDALTYWCTDVLTYWRTDVLSYCRTDVLTYCPTVVLTYWRTGLLTYWRSTEWHWRSDFSFIIYTS